VVHNTLSRGCIPWFLAIETVLRTTRMKSINFGTLAKVKSTGTYKGLDPLYRLLVVNMFFYSMYNHNTERLLPLLWTSNEHIYGKHTQKHGGTNDLFPRVAQKMTSEATCWRTVAHQSQISIPSALNFRLCILPSIRCHR
jgi:hypothetical protein